MQEKGHTFKTQTDTEVIVHLYEEEGEDCFKKLIGMFAIALWDKKSGKLFLVRDHVGIKPLYFAENSDGVVFASELQPVARFCNQSREIDLMSLHQYLRLGYIPSPLTIYKNIKKLQPGTYVCFEKSRTRLINFWHPRIYSDMTGNEYDVSSQLYERLRDSVKSNLISDVKLGTFLSGGIDSSTVTALMCELSGSTIETFSIGFEDERYNELPFAREVARMYKTEQHEFILKPDAIEILDTIVAHFGEPFSDPSALPTYYLSKMTRKYVKVALSGDGGDELFAGYNKYVSHKLSAMYLCLPVLLRKHFLENILRATTKRINAGSLKYELQWLLKIMTDADPNYINWYFTKASILRDSHLKEIMKTMYIDSAYVFEEMSDDIRRQNYNNFIDTMLYADQRFSLADRMLTKVDRMSMAHGLEVRVPLLNNDFVEFVNHIDVSYKLRGFKRKYLLKKVMQNKLPLALFKRKKQGFEVPLREWFKGNFSEYAKQVLNKQALAKHDLFNYEKVSAILLEHELGKADNSQQIYNLIIFQKWFNVCYS